jgi:hypothetical protein
LSRGWAPGSSAFTYIDAKTPGIDAPARLDQLQQLEKTLKQVGRRAEALGLSEEQKE